MRVLGPGWKGPWGTSPHPTVGLLPWLLREFSALHIPTSSLDLLS